MAGYYRDSSSRFRVHRICSATAACLQIAASSSNFALQEYPTGENDPPKSKMVSGAPVHDGKGYLLLPTNPGMGVELKKNAIKDCPTVVRKVQTRLHEYGSVIDQ